MYWKYVSKLAQPVSRTLQCVDANEIEMRSNGSNR